MLCLTCTTKTSVDLAQYGVSRAKDWVSVDCGTILHYSPRSSDVGKGQYRINSVKSKSCRGPRHKINSPF